VVAPVLHKKDEPPEAVSVAGPPAHGAGPDTLMLHAGCVLSWGTITSPKQLSAELNGLVIVKRYVPGLLIRIESRLLTVSLIPAPIGALFNVHISTGLMKSVL
jgi:hypothetical protein